MLELGDTGVVPVHCVVDRTVSLVELLLVGLKPEVQGAVGKLPKPEAEELVGLSGEDDRAGKGRAVQGDCSALQLHPVAGLHAQLHGDVGVVQDFLEHGRVALQGHPLVGVLEVPVVP